MTIPISQNRSSPVGFDRPESVPPEGGAGPKTTGYSDKFIGKIQFMSGQYSPKSLSTAFHRASQGSAILRQRMIKFAKEIAARITGKNRFSAEHHNEAQYSAFHSQSPLPANGTPYHPYQSQHYQSHGNPAYTPGFSSMPAYEQHFHQNVPRYPGHQSGGDRTDTPPKPDASLPQGSQPSPLKQVAVPNYTGAPVSMGTMPAAEVVEHLKKNGLTDKDLQKLKQDIREIYGAKGNSDLQEQFDQKYSHVFSGKITENHKSFALLMGRIKTS